MAVMEYTIQGVEEINEYLALTMSATLSSLVKAGKISDKDAQEFVNTHVAQEFVNTHVAQMVTSATMWYKIRKFLGIVDKKDYVVVKILKVVS